MEEVKREERTQYALHKLMLRQVGLLYISTLAPNPLPLHALPQPANLLLDAANTLRISDFGLATLRKSRNPPVPSQQLTIIEDAEQFDLDDDGEYLNLTGLTGSPRFMAPEVSLPGKG